MPSLCVSFTGSVFGVFEFWLQLSCVCVCVCVCVTVHEALHVGSSKKIARVSYRATGSSNRPNCSILSLYGTKIVSNNCMVCLDHLQDFCVRAIAHGFVHMLNVAIIGSVFFFAIFIMFVVFSVFCVA